MEGNSQNAYIARLRGEFYHRKDNGGNLSYVPEGIRLLTASGSAYQADRTLKVDSTLGAVVVLLPDAEDCPGHVLTVKRIDGSGAGVTVTPDGGDAIDDQGGYTLTVQYAHLTIQSDGVGWWIIDSYGADPVTYADSGAIWALIWFGYGAGFPGMQRDRARAIDRAQLLLGGRTFGGR